MRLSSLLSCQTGPNHANWLAGADHHRRIIPGPCRAPRGKQAFCQKVAITTPGAGRSIGVEPTTTPGRDFPNSAVLVSTASTKWDGPLPANHKGRTELGSTGVTGSPAGRGATLFPVLGQPAPRAWGGTLAGETGLGMLELACTSLETSQLRGVPPSVKTHAAADRLAASRP